MSHLPPLPTDIYVCVCGYTHMHTYTHMHIYAHTYTNTHTSLLEPHDGLFFREAMKRIWIF